MVVREHRRDGSPPARRVDAPTQSATPDPRSLTAHDALALQRTAGNRAVSRLVASLQRKPVKKGEDVFTDDKYPDVSLKEIRKYTVYSIESEKLTGTVIYYEADEDKYFHVTGNDKNSYDADYDQEFDISSASGSAPIATGPITKFDGIGQQGKGVSGVADPTTLRTTGLITCVGWLLYNQTAAYLTHIVVTSPKSVLVDGIQEQADALCGQFEQESGGSPSKLIIKVDPGNPSYSGVNVPGIGDLAWMKALKPANCPAFEVQFGGELAHTVDASKGATRKDWDGAAIKVTYKQ
jgi:hypothetical protein